MQDFDFVIIGNPKQAIEWLGPGVQTCLNKAPVLVKIIFKNQVSSAS